MKLDKLLSLLAIALIVLTGCQNDEEDQAVDVTTEEAKEMIDDSGNSLSTDVVSLVESEGVSELVKLVDLLDEHSVIYGRTSSKWTKERLNAIIQSFINGPSARVGMETPTSLEEIKGLYTWNPEIGDFDVEESDIFIVRFPAEGSEINNAKFKINALEYQIIDGVDWRITTPSMINCYLMVDEITYVELTYDVKWNENGNPQEADINLLLAPFRFEIDFVDVFATATSLLTSVSIDDEVIVSIDVDVTYESAGKDDFYLVEGSVQYRDLKIIGDIDLRNIEESADPNDYINLTLNSKDDKLGDIVFLLQENGDGFQEYIPYVAYSDGTTQNLEEILTPVFNEIEEIFADRD